MKQRTPRFQLLVMAAAFAAMTTGRAALAQQAEPEPQQPPDEDGGPTSPSEEEASEREGASSEGESDSQPDADAPPPEAPEAEPGTETEKQPGQKPEKGTSDGSESKTDPRQPRDVAEPDVDTGEGEDEDEDDEPLPLQSTSAKRELETADVGDIDLMNLLSIDVSTATKTSESLEEAPAIITAITADEISRWGYQSVGEVLQHVMGFYLIDDHITPNAAVRGVTGGLGAESSVIKVMIDGRSVAFRTTNGNWLGVELFPLSAIKQIEVIRGPASALYGADAFLGVVNIITLSPVDVPTVDARVTGGVVGDNPGGSFDVTGGFWGEKIDVMLTAAGEAKDRSGLSMPSQSPAPRVPGYNDPYGQAEDLRRKSLVFGGRVGYFEEKKGHHLVVSGYASGVRRGADYAHWSQLTAGEDSQGREVGSVVSLGQFRINADGLYQATRDFGLGIQTTYFQGGLLPADRVEVGSDLFYVERKMAYRGVDTNIEGRFIPSDRFNLIVGTEVIYDNETLPSASRINKEDGSSFDEEGAESADLMNVGAYVSSNLQVIDKFLKLTGGARYDYHNRYGSQTSGRLGATSVVARGLVLKALYGSAYKAPSPYLLFAEPLVPGDVVGNEDLKPQFIHTWEGQVSYKPNHVFQATTGVSYSLLLDKAEFIPQGINQAAQNTARQNAFTWESRIDLRDGDAVGGYGSFELVRSYRQTEQEGYQADVVGFDMIAYPEWMARTGAYVGLPSPESVPLELATQAIFVGPRRATDTSILENGGSFDLDPYVLWNASLRTRAMTIFPHQETFAALRAKNLLGAGGPDPGFSGFEYPLAAREIFLELRHRY